MTRLDRGGWLALLFLLGCTPSPERLCQHVTRVVEDQFGPDDPLNPKQSHIKGVKHCMEIWSAKQKKDPKGYACYADCAMDFKHFVDLAECQPKCFPNEAKPADDVDKAKGMFWSPDAATTATTDASPNEVASSDAARDVSTSESAPAAAAASVPAAVSASSKPSAAPKSAP